MVSVVKSVIFKLDLQLFGIQIFEIENPFFVWAEYWWGNYANEAIDFNVFLLLEKKLKMKIHFFLLSKIL